MCVERNFLIQEVIKDRFLESWLELQTNMPTIFLKTVRYRQQLLTFHPQYCFNVSCPTALLSL